MLASLCATTACPTLKGNNSAGSIKAASSSTYSTGIQSGLYVGQASYTVLSPAPFVVAAGSGGGSVLCSPGWLETITSSTLASHPWPLVLVSQVLILQVNTTKPTLRTHFKMAVTLDSLVGQGPALTFCGLKGQNRRISIKKTFPPFRKMFSYFTWC